MKTKVKAFVDAYNAVVTSTRSKISEKSIADATTVTDAAKGSLFGDSGLLACCPRCARGWATAMPA
jgi:flagellar hook-associated protein 2